jgi:hypothetical protein
VISVRYGEPENKPPNIQKHAVSDDRIRDLGIMKPTRYQLRYHHHVLEPAESHKNNIRAFRIGGEVGGRVGRLCGGRAAIRHDDKFEALALAVAPN